jgi:hypothetical protein
MKRRDTRDGPLRNSVWRSSFVTVSSSATGPYSGVCQLVEDTIAFPCAPTSSSPAIRPVSIRDHDTEIAAAESGPPCSRPSGPHEWGRVGARDEIVPFRCKPVDPVGFLYEHYCGHLSIIGFALGYVFEMAAVRRVRSPYRSLPWVDERNHAPSVLVDRTRTAHGWPRTE